MAFRYGIRLITKPARNDMRLTQVQVSKLTRILFQKSRMAVLQAHSIYLKDS